MKNILWLYAILYYSICAYATGLQDKVESFIPKNTYQMNINFIKKLFGNEKKFYKGNHLDIAKVLTTLKNNGLLQLKLSKPSNISVTFRINFLDIQTDSNPSFMFLNYTTNNILTNMGYSYFYVTEAIKRQDKILLTYTLNAESHIDPVVMIDNLIKRGYRIVDIKRNTAIHWIYDISLGNSYIPHANVIVKGENTFNQINGKYWFVFNSIGILRIIPQDNVEWYPKILMFDSNMNLINAIISVDKQNSYNLKITKEIQYIMITDNYNASVLRNGITLDFTID